MKKSLLLILIFAAQFAGAQVLLTQVSQIDTGFRQIRINSPCIVGIPYFQNELIIYTLDTLDVPFYSSTVALSDSAISLGIVNSFVAVGGAHQLMLVDMTVPDTAIEVATINVSGAIQHVSFYDEIFAVEQDSANSYYLLRVNVDDPYFPYSIDSLQFSFPLSEMIVYGDYGYVLETQDSTSDLYIYDLTVDSALSQAAVVSLPLYNGIDVNDSDLFLYNADGISVFSLNNPIDPQLNFTFSSSGVEGVAGIRSTEYAGLYSNSCNAYLNVNGYTFIDTLKQGDSSLTVLSYDSLLFYSTSTHLYIYTRDTLTGINEVLSHVKVSVFPNPSHNDINFDFSSLPPGTHTLSIVDMHGQLILQRAVSENDIYTMDDALASGTYLFRLSDENKIISAGKIIVQR